MKRDRDSEDIFLMPGSEGNILDWETDTILNECSASKRVYENSAIRALLYAIRNALLELEPRLVSKFS